MTHKALERTLTTSRTPEIGPLGGSEGSVTSAASAVSRKGVSVRCFLDWADHLGVTLLILRWKDSPTAGGDTL